MDQMLKWPALIIIALLLLTGCGQGSTNPDSSSHPGENSNIFRTTAKGSHSADPTTTYLTYHDTIWGYSLSVPPNFTAFRVPLDGDGESWKSAAVRISVYGQYKNIQSGASTVALLLQKLSLKHATYKAHGADWLVVSAVVHHTIHYTKIYLGSGTEDVLNIEYPAQESAQWTSRVGVIAHSFHPGPLVSK